MQVDLFAEQKFDQGEQHLSVFVSIEEFLFVVDLFFFVVEVRIELPMNDASLERRDRVEDDVQSSISNGFDPMEGQDQPTESVLIGTQIDQITRCKGTGADQCALTFLAALTRLTGPLQFPRQDLDKRPVDRTEAEAEPSEKYLDYLDS